MDGRHNRRNKPPFLNSSWVVWTGPKELFSVTTPKKCLSVAIKSISGLSKIVLAPQNTLIYIIITLHNSIEKFQVNAFI